MKPLTSRNRARGLVLASALLFGPLPLAAQSVLDRTPNLAGGWAGTGGTAYVNSLHRFAMVDGPGDEGRLVHSPTLLLGYSLADLFLLGTQYASSSTTVPGRPNEWEAFGRLAPFPAGAGLPFELALTGAYNGAAESLDGEISLGVPLGPATFMGAFRSFSDGYGEKEGRSALGAGVRLRLGERLSLSGDWVSPTDEREGEQAGWGAALQIALPEAPYTLSLQATNTATATLQGSSRAEMLADGNSVGTRWGFELTVPLDLARYFGPSAAERDRTLTADTVRVAIRDFEFEVTRLVVQPGTTVVWTNEGNLPHTSSSDDGVWNSSLMAPGESYARVFAASGEYPYHCQPHPTMTATVVVQEP